VILRMLARVMLAIAIGVPAATFAAPLAETGKLQFVKPASLRGTLGDAQVQLNLRTKTEFDDGVEGDYFVFGRSQKILLAGEIEGDEVFLEESENGTDVSGQWNGKLSGDTLSGEWQSADGTTTKSFTVRIVRSNAAAKRMATTNSTTDKK
jgi:hypothetical protein